MANAKLEIVNMTKLYSNGDGVKNVNLSVSEGELVTLLGPSGCGKTTILRTIGGFIDLNEGDILINGKSIQKEPLEAKRQFGLVPDNPDMFLRLKGIEYLNFMGDIYDVDAQQRQQRIETMAEIFEIKDVLNDKILSYSHGMRQKIIIMGALINDPEVWILDEPMTGLDPQSSFHLKQMMREHANKGKTVFFSTHVLEVAEKLCDKIAIIAHGRTSRPAWRTKSGRAVP